jgi:DNA-binding transcriptional LysR family regulator
MVSNSRELIRDCVASGMGIAAVSEIEFVPGPDVRMLRIRDCPLHIEAHLVCLAERSELRLVRAFLDSCLAVAP